MPTIPSSICAALDRMQAPCGRALLRLLSSRPSPLRLLPLRLLPAVVACALCVLAPVPAAAQGEASASLSTADGIYTTAQAKRGADVYAGQCQSCHTAASHAGSPFRNKWVGRPLSELFDYIIREMPKTEPGTLTMENYTVVLAYMLRTNGMPAGRRALTSDAKALKTIRIGMPTDDDASAAAVR